jgi:hypothetical protein
MRRTEMHRTLLALVLLAGGELHVAAAAAQERTSAASSPSREEQAQSHFQRGIERYDDGEYSLALVEFQRAYALRPGYPLLFNIGQVHFHLRQYAKARLALEKYLDEGRGKLGSERREQVEQQLITLRSRTAELRVTVNVVGAEVSINDEEIGTSPLVTVLFVDAGTQRVAASKLGYTSTRSTIIVAGGDVAAIDLTLIGQADVAPRSSNVPATLSWVGTGVLGAGAIGVGVATLLASRRYSEMREERLAGSPAAAREQLDEQRSLVSTLATTTDILAGATLAVTGLALYFTLRSPSGDDARGSAHARIGANGVSVTCAF